MRFKNMMLVTCLLLAILTIGAVSASDDLASDVAGEVSDESDDLSVENSISQEDCLEAGDSDSDLGDWNQLWEDVRDAPANSTVSLSHNYISDGSDLPVSKPMTINGNGHVIDANGSSKVITAQANLVVKNITFMNCHAVPTHFGTVLGYDYTISIFDCKFVNCDYAARSANIVIKNCSFENCYNAVGSDSNLNIVGCSFKNCSGNPAGAIFINEESNGTIINCSFVDCYSEYNAGAISFRYGSSGSIVGCSFENCYSKDDDHDGGAIRFYSPSGSVVDCSFVNCHAVDDGGAISFMMSSDPGDLIVKNSSFTNCSCGDSGGAIILYGNSLTVSDANFMNCSGGAGGAIYSSGDLNVSKSGFVKCVANGGAAGAVFSDNFGNFVDCSFVNCSSAYAGGAIYMYPGIVNSSYFINCSADDYGGGICFNSNESKMFDCYFEDNAAKNGSDWYSEYNITNTITKLTTSIEASKVIATYGVLKSLTVTLKDANGNVLSNKQIKLVLNGNTYYKNTTSDGKVIFAVPTNLVPKSYNAQLSFADEGKYIASAKTVTVTVKKATPKLTAKAKTFKKSVKTKKYAVTLKTNLNKVMKNIKVKIKVNKKTYTAKTNSKGVATFKITKLTKKGKHTATVNYAGSKYYNSKSVKVKITVK